MNGECTRKECPFLHEVTEDGKGVLMDLEERVTLQEASSMPAPKPKVCSYKTLVDPDWKIKAASGILECPKRVLWMQKCREYGAV